MVPCRGPAAQRPSKPSGPRRVTSRSMTELVERLDTVAWCVNGTCPGSARFSTAGRRSGS
jgi:hypothetical protein